MKLGVVVDALVGQGSDTRISGMIRLRMEGSKWMVEKVLEFLQSQGWQVS